ncbi:MAG: GtrA family protein [Methylococcaceae bacterium]|nr:GtrA family protein [Methylococcaceae bacterium]
MPRHKPKAKSKPKRKQKPRRISAKIQLGEKLRYLLVGAFNTVSGYSVFAALWLLWGDALPYQLWGYALNYLIVLVISHIINVTSAFICYRIWVFKKQGGIVGDFIRFNMVYLGAFGFNMAVLPILVGQLHFHPLVAQALVIAVTVVSSYILHRRFSFKLGKQH